MASCTTPLWGNTSTCPRIRFTVTESSSTVTTATLSWTLEYYAGASGVTSSVAKSYSAVIAGQTVASGTYSINKKTGWNKISSGTKTINKGTSAQTISFSCSMGFNLTWSGTYGGTKKASGNIGVSAKAKYTISYNANGGTGAPGAQTKWAGSNITLSTTKPTRTGYSFQGWSTSASGSVNYASGANYTGNANLTLYAVWKANTYTVTYNANGGTGAPVAQIKTYGVNLTLSATKPTRTNYNFKGWGTSAGSTTVAYASGATYTSNAAITLYAIWELAYTIPRITNLTADRCNSSGTLIEEGTYALVKFNWSTDKTVTSIKIEYRLASSTDAWTSVSVSGSGTGGVTVSKIIGGSFDIEKEYSVKVTVIDSIDENNSTTSVAPITYEIDFLNGGGGVTIGRPAEKKGFNVHMDSEFNKSLKVQGKELSTLILCQKTEPTNQTDGSIFLMEI